MALDRARDIGCEERGRESESEIEMRARANPRSLIRAAYHNLISFNIWGEAVGCRRRAKVVTPGVGRGYLQF